MSVEFLNPSSMFASSAFSQGVAISGEHKVLFIGGQNGVDPSGNVVAKGDIAGQTRQAFHNLSLVLAEGGASIENVVKFTVYIVQGQPLQPGFGVYQEVWDGRPNPPAISAAFVAGLANPDFLVEIEAIAVV